MTIAIHPGKQGNRIAIKPGDRFGKLIVLHQTEERRHKCICWICQCDCGNQTVAIGYEMYTGHTLSCGCRKVKHGKSSTVLYKRWGAMKKRCQNPNAADYHRYGGRGIAVCDEWREFSAFEEWAIENGFSEELEIDRIDNDKGYSPDNCQFITPKRNARKRGNNHPVTIGNETKTIAEWSEQSGINKSTLKDRIRYGWPAEKLLIPPQK